MLTFMGYGPSTILAAITALEKQGPHKAEPCPCPHNCGYWHVRPEAELQGVSFTEEQARLVAGVLNLQFAHDQDKAVAQSTEPR